MQIVMLIGFLVWGMLLVGYAVRTLFGKRGPIKAVKAQVVEKFTQDVFSKSQGLMKKRYYVVFLMDGKKRTFAVSAFSYGGYRLRERGTLRYCGSRVIDFQ